MARIDYSALKIKSGFGPIARFVGTLILKLLGWRVAGPKPSEKKYIIIVGGHTSNWDAFILFVGAAHVNCRIYWMGKSTLFKGLFGRLMYMLNGVPIDRSAHHGVVSQMVELFNSHDELVLLITPEATRSCRPHWKTGFYHIAQQARVPVCLGYINYDQNVCGFGPMLSPSGDIEKDFDTIRDFYLKVTVPKHPENFGPIALPPHETSSDEKASGTES